MCCLAWTHALIYVHLLQCYSDSSYSDKRQRQTSTICIFHGWPEPCIPYTYDTLCIMWFPSQKYRIFTVYIHFWPTLCISFLSWSMVQFALLYSSPFLMAHILHLPQLFSQRSKFQSVTSHHRRQLTFTYHISPTTCLIFIGSLVYAVAWFFRDIR